MITPEERKTLKVGDVVHTIIGESQCVWSGEVIDNNTADFTFFTRGLDYEHMYIKKIDAYRTVRKMKLDEIDPWSGLSYAITHSFIENEDCPISHFNDVTLGAMIYNSREELIKAWNTRKGD